MDGERFLVAPRQLAAMLRSDEPPVVADCRHALADPEAGALAFAAGHIPGAFHVHLDRDLSGPRGPTGGRHPLPAPEAFAGLLASLGVGPGRLLVACDDSGGAWAARLWWLARVHGHAQACLLDGGWAGWVAEGLPAETGPGRPRLESGARACVPERRAWLDHADLAPLQAARRVRLVDSRDARRYQGLEEPVDPVAGHIPGALNVPWSGSTGADGRFLAPEAQRERWTSAGLGEDGLVVYCGSGVTACVNLFSRALAGFRDDRLYPGSWSDWCSRPGAEVATGPEPG